MTEGRPSLAFRRLSVVTVCATYLLIVWGGLVRVTASGRGCDSPHGGVDQWPLCDGSLVPPFTQAGLIEFTHRWLATVASTLIIALAVWVFLRYRHVRRLVVGAALTIVLIVVEITLGQITIATEESGGVVLIHLANALLLLSALIFVAVSAVTVGTDRSVSWSAPPAKSRLAAIAAVVTYLVVLTGSNVVAQGAGAACYGWPFCAPNGGIGFTLASVGPASVNLLHRFAVGILLLLLGATVAIVRKVHKVDRAMFRTGMAINIVLLLQIVAGALVVELNLPSWARGVHLALAGGLLALTVLFALLARRPTNTPVPAAIVASAT
jgi:cytochrome c oxidase assembly protein subunit 15